VTAEVLCHFRGCGCGSPWPAPEPCEGGNREGAPSPGHSRARSDQTVCPGLRPIGAYAPEGTIEETSAKREVSLAHQCELALENNLEEWSTHFWGNS